MTADLLRRAAAAMRERAEPIATLAPWYRMYGNVYHAGGNPIVENTGQLAAEHIASWHPAVALAVADWLDVMAEVARYAAERGYPTANQTAAALKTARAYLGEDAS